MIYICLGIINKIFNNWFLKFLVWVVRNGLGYFVKKFYYLMKVKCVRSIKFFYFLFYILVFDDY